MKKKFDKLNFTKFKIFSPWEKPLESKGLTSDFGEHNKANMGNRSNPK